MLHRIHLFFLQYEVLASPDPADVTLVAQLSMDRYLEGKEGRLPLLRTEELWAL